MARLLAIDYGRKRVGLAVTDPLQIIATALDTVPANLVLSYLSAYIKREPVELLVLGLAKNLDNSDSESMLDIKPFAEQLKQLFPDIPLVWIDERYTSKIALRAMIDGGMRKSERRKKENVDKISAVIILQSYMEQRDASHLN